MSCLPGSVQLLLKELGWHLHIEEEARDAQEMKLEPQPAPPLKPLFLLDSLL